MMKVFGMLVLVAAMLIGAGTAQAQFKAGDWSLTMTGGGASSRDFDDTAFTIGGSVTKFFTDNIEAGVRQSLSYVDGMGGSTAVVADYNITQLHLCKDKLVPFVGANIGYAYGNDTDRLYGGPEAGLRYFVNETTYLYGAVTYEFDLSEGSGVGYFGYSVGIGFRW